MWIPAHHAHGRFWNHNASASASSLVTTAICTQTTKRRSLPGVCTRCVPSPREPKPPQRSKLRSREGESAPGRIAIFSWISRVAIVTLPVVIATGVCRPPMSLLPDKHCRTLIRSPCIEVRSVGFRVRGTPARRRPEPQACFVPVNSRCHTQNTVLHRRRFALIHPGALPGGRPGYPGTSAVISRTSSSS